MSFQQNPLGLNGLDFIEFATPEPEVMRRLFESLGFVQVARHKTKAVDLFRQGHINFVLNREPGTFAAKFAQKHGPSICATGFCVPKARSALDEAVKRGARAVSWESDPQSHSFPAMHGIGDSAIYFIEGEAGQHFRNEFDFIEGRPDKMPIGFGLLEIDHLTNNVPKGEMDKWCAFYRDIFNFQEVRFFNIRGQATGLLSKVMRSPCGRITIPINEPTEGKSQIQEYLDEYNGSGIQHVALATSDIVQSVQRLRSQNIQFLETPDTYYEMVPERLPQVTESLSVLKDLRILVDGDLEGYLLQIFTQNLIVYSSKL